MAADLDPVVADQIPEALALAMGLTGDRVAATELVGTALVAQRRRRATSDPAVELRNATVHQFVNGHARSTPARVPPPGDDHRLSPELTAIAGRLDQLSPLARSVVVLSLRERITQAEIAGILDRPVALVVRTLDEALATLAASTGDIAVLLDRLAWSAPEPHDTRAAALRAGRRRTQRRHRIGALAASLIGVLVLALVAVTVVVPRVFPVHVRESRVWASGFAPGLPAGWTIQAHYLETDEETYLVGTPDHATDCQLSAAGTGPAAAVLPSGSPVRVNRRPGSYADSTDDGTRTLTWFYAPSARASVSCNRGGDVDRRLLALAQQVEFRPAPMTLPFRVRQLPVGYEAVAIGTYLNPETATGQLNAVLVLAPAGAGEDSDDAILVILPGDRPESRDPHTVRVQGAEAVLESEGGYLSVCLPVQGQNACLQSGSGGDDRARQDDPAVRRLLTLAEGLEFAADLSEPATWIDAREAVPR